MYAQDGVARLVYGDRSRIDFKSSFVWFKLACPSGTA